MDQATRENLLLIVSLVNIAAALVSASLAVYVFRTLKQEFKPKKKASKELVLWSQRPQAYHFDIPTGEIPVGPVRRSPLAAGERRLNDDFWGDPRLLRSELRPRVVVHGTHRKVQ